MTLTPLWLWIAAGFAFLTWCVHTFLGQIWIVPPLLNAPIHVVPKYTHFYCWHLVTLMIAALVAAFAWAALDPAAWEVAVLATVISAIACLWSAVLTATVRRNKPWQMPPWGLFGLTTGAALMSLVR